MSRGSTIKPTTPPQAKVETDPDVLRDLANSITEMTNDLASLLREVMDDTPRRKFWRRKKKATTTEDWRIQRLRHIADSITKTPCRGQMFVYIDNVDANWIPCTEPRGHHGNHEGEVSVGTHAVKVQWSGPEED